MDRVSFITAETGDDLIVSFVVPVSDDPADIRSLILLRTPKYEYLVEEHERGVSVSFEGRPENEDDYLQRIEYIRSEAVVRIQTLSDSYELDVRKVEAQELKEMCKVLKKMNYDQKFQLSGV